MAMLFHTKTFYHIYLISKEKNNNIFMSKANLITFNFPLNKAWVIVFILKVSVLQSMIFMEFVNCFYNIFHVKILTKFYNIEKCKNPNFITFWGL